MPWLVAANGRVFAKLAYDLNDLLRVTDPQGQPLPLGAEAAVNALFDMPDVVWGVVQTMITVGAAVR